MINPDKIKERFFAPNAERTHPWLGGVFQAYAFMDSSLEWELSRTRRKPACGAGCGECCRQPIPLTYVELMGLKIYLNEITTLPVILADNPLHCPLLVDDACIAYPARPFACRRFIVFGSPCVAGQDPTLTRPADVLQPSRQALLQALRLLLPAFKYFGIIPENSNPQTDFFNKHTVILQQAVGLLAANMDHAVSSCRT